MKKQNLKLFEILNLEAEINGVNNPNTGEILIEGLLNQAISYGTKFNIKVAIKSIIEMKKDILNIQDELLTKYGNLDDKGLIGLSKFITDNDGNVTPNPKFIEFQKEWTDFLNDNSKEIEFPLLSLSELQSIKTKDNYKIIDQYFVIE